MTYVRSGEFAYEDGHDNTRNRCYGIGQGHQGSGKVRSYVDMVGQESAEHPSNAHDGQRHQHHGQGPLTANVAKNNKAHHRHHAGATCSQLPGNRGVYDLLLAEGIQRFTQDHAEKPHA